MRRLLAFGAVLVVLCAAGGSDLSACGEKFYFVGRLVKYQQPMTAQVPGLVLLYTNPASTLPATLRETKLADMLKAAGHKVETVSDPAALTRALGTGRYDLLLVSAADMAAAPQWKTAAPAITVVPVLYKATKAEQQAATQASAKVLKADKTNDAIVLVNNLIKARPKARATP